jgi:Asp-tRNA(Asn)/Glu-tRNA(Gln) amidotransferase A subunit family amidase
VAETTALFPRRREIEVPLAPSNRSDFMREAADVHRALFPGNEESYGENVRVKVERCLRVTDGEVAAAERDRSEYRERMAEAVRGLDLLVTPTVPFVAPRADVDELEIRGRGTSFTYPFNALGWPALALPCGPAEDGLPASVQLVGKPGDDALVLAAGAVVEAALSLERGTPAPA